MYALCFSVDLLEVKFGLKYCNIFTALVIGLKNYSFMYLVTKSFGLLARITIRYLHFCTKKKKK